METVWNPTASGCKLICTNCKDHFLGESMPSSQPAATYNIFDLIDQIADTVNKMLNEKQKEH
jgi:hypothetical protein